MNINKPHSFTMVPIQRTDIFQTIISRINTMVDESMNPGDRLPSERELAESLGVSRTSVRQALKVLESSGKLETRVGSGTYVRKKGSAVELPLPLSFSDNIVDMEFIRKLIIARAAIERAVFDDSFDKITTDHIQELNNLLQDNAQELASLTHSEEEGMDLSFESKVAGFGRNEILMHLQQQVHELWMVSWQKFGYVPQERKVLHQEHIEILSAMEMKNKELVLELIVRHVDKSLD